MYFQLEIYFLINEFCEELNGRMLERIYKENYINGIVLGMLCNSVIFKLNNLRRL